jgi:1,4-alpha-glucan branching enzyme
MKSVVADPLAYDWQGDRPLYRPSRETAIYELHVPASPPTPVQACRRSRPAPIGA